MISQFHEFFSNQIFGGFLSFGPTVDRSWPPTLPSRARVTTPRRQRSPCLSSVLWPLSTLANSSTVANRLTKDCYLATSGKVRIFSKSPMYFNVILTDFLTLRSSASSHRPHSLNTMNNSTQPVVCESSCLT